MKHCAKMGYKPAVNSLWAMWAQPNGVEVRTHREVLKNRLSRVLDEFLPLYNTSNYDRLTTKL